MINDVWSLMAAARQIDRSKERLDNGTRSAFTPSEYETILKLEAVILNNEEPDAKTEQLLRFAGVVIKSKKEN